MNSGENRLASVDAYVTEPGLHWSMSTGHGDQRQARVRIMLDRLERGRAYGAFTGLTKHIWSSLRSTVLATVPKPVENDRAGPAALQSPTAVLDSLWLSHSVRLQVAHPSMETEKHIQQYIYNQSRVMAESPAATVLMC